MKIEFFCVKNSFSTTYFLLFAGEVVAWHIPSDLQADDGVTLSFLQFQRFNVFEVITVVSLL